MAVCLVVSLLGRADEVQHVCADQQLAKLLEVTVVFVLDYSTGGQCKCE